MLSYALVTLYLMYILSLQNSETFYGYFQSNQKLPPTFNQRPEVYSTILIALGPTLEVDFGLSSYD